tara:strand:+ start:754 stop:1410 length:657 start_codon:yes stop_codon:yes gene_type:complete
MDKDLLRFDKSSTFVLCDFETYNLCLNFTHNRPWQAGLIKVKNNKIVDSLDLYIKWKTKLKIGEEAAKITRYSEAKFQKRAISHKEAFDKMYPWFEECDYIIGHNFLGFDIYLLKGYYELMGKEYSHLVEKIIDTNCLSRGIKYEMPFRRKNGKASKEELLLYQYKIMNTKKKRVKSRLETLGKEFGIEHDYDTLHDALSDLQLNLKVWNKLKLQIDI